MIIATTPDLTKSKALRTMASITLQRLGEMDTLKYPSLTLCDYYDILHKLMDALLSAQGKKTKGERAHKELIEEIAKNMSLPESSRILLQDLREYRNRIAYEGFTIQSSYIESNSKAIERLIQEIDKKLGDLL